MRGVIWYPRGMKSRISCRILLVSVALLVSLSCSGCSAKKKVVTTVTREVVAQPDGDSDSEEVRPRVISETTETSTEQMGSFCSGVLSCTIEGIGWVLALPFRAIVGFLDVMF